MVPGVSLLKAQPGAMSKRKDRAPLPPVEATTLGPDRKGRFHLEIEPGGKTLSFYSGVPGELVKVRRGRRSRRGEQGDILEVIEPHVLRREVRCRHFAVCGGCTMQQMPEEEVLKAKSSNVMAKLAELAPLAKAHPPVPSPQSFFYRNKVELSFLCEADGQTRLGFHRRGRFDKVLDIERCWLSALSPQVIATIRSWASVHQLKGWDTYQGKGDLRFLLYRRSSTSGHDLLALVLDDGVVLSPETRGDLVKRLAATGLKGARLLWQTSPAQAIVPDREESLFGPQSINEYLGPLEFQLSWKSFFQVNPSAYLRLLETMKAWRRTPPGARLLDLFCGVGSIGLYLKHPEDELTGVELVEEAVADARRCALHHGIRARFEAMPCESWTTIETDLLLLDPPRAGCHPKLLSVLAQRAPSKELFYVSCNPYRLLEELPDFLRSYRLLGYQAFDFFPQTHHVEFLLHFEAR